MKKVIIIMAVFLAGFTHANTQISLNINAESVFVPTMYEMSEEPDVTISERLISINEKKAFGFNMYITHPYLDLSKGAYLSVVDSNNSSPIEPDMTVDIGETQYRNCGTVPSDFYIYEIDYRYNRKILAMDFLLNCPHSSDTITGSIRVNSKIPIPYTAPFPVIRTDYARFDDGSNFFIYGDKSFSRVDEIESYVWSQVSGPKINIISPESINTELSVVDTVKLGGEDAVFKLTVTDKSGRVESTEIFIYIYSKSDPLNYVKTNGDAKVGVVPKWFYNMHPSVITLRDDDPNGIWISINYFVSWYAHFLAPDNAPLKVGMYTNAQYYPFEDSNLPEMSISGNGKGCEVEDGYFNISKLVYKNDKIDQLKINFEQQCDFWSVDSPALIGEIGINLLNDSVPVSDAGLDLEANEGSIVELDGSNSLDKIGIIVGYQWETSEVDVVLQDSSKPVVSFKAPLLENGVESRDVKITLLVIDDEGYQSQDSVNVKIIKPKIIKPKEGSSSSGGSFSLWLVLLMISIIGYNNLKYYKNPIQRID